MECTAQTAIFLHQDMKNIVHIFRKLSASCRLPEFPYLTGARAGDFLPLEPLYFTSN